MSVTGRTAERVVETARLAREAVAARPDSVSQEDLISDLPGEHPLRQAWVVSSAT